MANNINLEDFKHWKEITNGVYTFVPSINATYEIHLIYRDYKTTDIFNAQANLFIAGNWTGENKDMYFERECLLSEATLKMCLEEAEEHFRKYVEPKLENGYMEQRLEREWD